MIACNICADFADKAVLSLTLPPSHTPHKSMLCVIRLINHSLIMLYTRSAIATLSKHGKKHSDHKL